MVVPDGGPDGKATAELAAVVAGNPPAGAHSEIMEAEVRRRSSVAAEYTLESAATSPTSPSGGGGTTEKSAAVVEHYGVSPAEATGPKSSISAAVGSVNEKFGIESDAERRGGTDSDTDEYAKIYVPDDTEEVVDPRLKDYPVPLVAKTVDLHNDFK